MPFDLTEKDVIRLIELVQDSDISQFRLVTPNGELHLSKGQATIPPAAVPPAPVVAAPAAPPPEAPPEDNPRYVAVTAPMIGICYRAPEPGADPFVAVGSRVEPGTTVALIEAMKVFSAVSAGVSGVVVQIRAQNAAPVEYGETLLLIDPDPAER